MGTSTRGTQLAALNDAVREWHRHHDWHLTYESRHEDDAPADAENHPVPLTVLGPSRHELEEHAPDLITALESREKNAPDPENSHQRPVHAVIRDNDELVEGLRDHERRQADWPHFPIVVLALPPDLDVRPALAELDENVDLLPGVLKGAAGVAAISCRTEGGFTFAICPPLAERDAATTSYLGQAWLSKPFHRIEMVQQMLSQPVRSEVRRYRSPFNYPTPSAIWHFGQDEPFALVTLYNQDDGDDWTGRITHLRQNMVLGDVVRASGVAAGKLARGDDDLFVPKVELLAQGDWSPRSKLQSDLWRHLAASRGLPLEQVGRIAEVRPADRGLEPNDRDLFLDDDLYVTMVPPEGEQDGRVFRLTCGTAADTFCLRSLLLQPASVDDLRCAAGGSLEHPRLSAAVIRDLCLIEPSSVSKLCDPLVRRRNRIIHGGPTDGVSAEPEYRQARDELEALMAALPHLNRVLPIHIDAVSATRAEVTVQLRRLSGENEAFEPEELRGPPNGGLRQLLQGEVYALDLASASDRLVSLWPWITLASLDPGRPLVWLFNDCTRDTLGYSSPQSAKPLTIGGMGSELASLLGL